MFPQGKCHYTTCTISNALKFCFHPSFFKHTIPILFPDLDHALKHIKMVQPLEAVALYACRCAYTHIWQDDHVSNWKARHQQWMIIQVECIKGNLENRGQPFPVSAGKTGSIYNKGQGFVMTELSLYDIFFPANSQHFQCLCQDIFYTHTLILASQPTNISLSHYPHIHYSSLL